MRTARRRFALVLAAAAVATAALAATPQTNAADSLNARQTHMEIARSWKAITDELQKPEVDKPLVVKNADALALYAPQMGGWSPKGAGSEAGLKTGARTAISSDPKGFLLQIQQFEERTKKFQAIAHNGDVAEMKTFAPQVGAACKSCHERFGGRTTADRLTNLAGRRGVGWAWRVVDAVGIEPTTPPV